MTRIDHEDIRIGTIVPWDSNTPEYIRQILPHGFECFQLSASTTLLEMNVEEEAEKILKVLDDSGAFISSFFHGANVLGEKEEDQKSREVFEKLIQYADLLDVSTICGFSGRVRGKPIPESIDRLKEVWSPLLDLAGEKGSTIAFENCSMGGTWQNGDWNIAHSPSAWELIFDALPHQNLGLEWEPCHQMVLLMDPMPQIREWGHKFFHIHGKDATIHRDTIDRYGIEGGRPFAFHRTPGFGDSNWTEIIGELRRIGYKGTIDIEGWHDPVYVNELEMTGQVHALNYLKNCRGGSYISNPVFGE